MSLVDSYFGSGTADIINGAGSSAPSWFSGVNDMFSKGFDFLNSNSKGLGAAGSLWGAYNQQNMGNKMLGLQKDAFDYNKMLSEEERKRRQEADANMATGFANSSYGKV